MTAEWQSNIIYIKREYNVHCIFYVTGSLESVTRHTADGLFRVI